MDTNEGSVGSTGKPKKRVRPKHLYSEGGKVSPDRWVDAELVKKRAELRYDGKLGVWEAGKFVLWRQFSGKSFDELQDTVSLGEWNETDFIRLASVWWLVLKKFSGKLGNGDIFKSDDLGMLFLMYRIQQANEDTVFTRGLLRYYTDKEGLRPIAHSFKLTNDWVKRMRRRGMIEQIPGLLISRIAGQKLQKVAMFRVSSDGRRVIKQALEAFREVHKDISYWAKTSTDREYLRRVVARFTLGISYEELESAETNEQFDGLVEATKTDLKKMGVKVTGVKPEYWWDMPE